MCAPSPSNFAAYIQFPEYLISFKPVVLANAKLVKDSPNVTLAIALGSIRPLIGASPILVAPPVLPKCVCEITAQSFTGICNSPAHCCWTIKPVTERSTFVVKKRFEHTDGNFNTRPRTSFGESVIVNGFTDGGALFKSYFFFGTSPKTFSKSKSSGNSPTVPGLANGSFNVTRPLPFIDPSTLNGHRSLAQTFSMIGNDSGLMSMAEFSWYSAPQISRTDMVSSPSFTARMLISPPFG
mmetsp:Transcript_5486/g.17343  ORF Transcript_5486/g.17343 Transcript_5486/m.17343 type:complete len:239 (-) Transcript_5486:1864-2580(-)